MIPEIIRNILDPNESHSRPAESWTDEDLEILQSAREQALENNLKAAKGKFDRINCKQALKAFQSRKPEIQFYLHRLRAERRWLNARSESEKGGNQSLAKRFIEDALASANHCQSEELPEGVTLSPQDKELFLRIEAMHSDLADTPAQAETQAQAADPLSAPLETAEAVQSPEPEVEPVKPSLKPETPALKPEVTPPPQKPKQPSLPRIELPEPVPQLQWQLTGFQERELTLLGIQSATIGRSSKATVAIGVDPAEYLDEDRSNRRISRIHFSISLCDNEIMLHDGYINDSGIQKTSGNGCFLGPDRITEEGFFHHSQKDLRLIDSNSAAGIPHWQISHWRTSELAIPETILNAIKHRWRPEQPAALHLARQDREEDLLFVWTAFPLSYLIPNAKHWLVMHKGGYLIFDGDDEWQPLNQQTFAKCHQ